MLEEQIGQGGMAVVFRAHDERLDRTVALKILAPGLADDDAFRQRFIRESRAAAAVDDPHIIPVYEAGEESGVLFIAMRYVQGGDVGSVIRHTGRLTLEEAAGIVSQIASALDAAHGRGLVHRDVKPTNMLLDAGRNTGRPDHAYLSDFGLSKAEVTAAKITGTGQFLGTLSYISPEQVSGGPTGPPSDQYSLACAAFELLSGTTPYERDTPVAVMYAHLHEAPPSLTERRPGLPPALNAVLERALAKAPADRYPSCREFAEAMRSAAGLRPYRGDTQAEGDGRRTQAPAPTVLTGDAEEQPAVTVSPAVPTLTAVDAARDGSPVTVATSWWRSRLAIGAAAAVAVLAGGGALLLSDGGNPPSGAVIIRSDFTSSADGWQVLRNPADGRISNGSFYIRATSSGNGEVGVPMNASRVYPSAPPNIRVDVSAHSSKGPAKYVQYGIACRDKNGSSYVFTVQGKQVSIGKFEQSAFSPLGSANSDAVNAGGTNQLSAVCESVAGQQAVRLIFTVNGVQLLDVTDRGAPLRDGTVGLFANFYGVSLPNGVEAAFQNFVVRQI